MASLTPAERVGIRQPVWQPRKSASRRTSWSSASPLKVKSTWIAGEEFAGG